MVPIAVLNINMYLINSYSYSLFNTVSNICVFVSMTDWFTEMQNGCGLLPSNHYKLIYQFEESYLQIVFGEVHGTEMTLQL